jgi:hypothetical protein
VRFGSSLEVDVLINSLITIVRVLLQLCASLAQLVARRSHNPKVVSSILTGGIILPLPIADELCKILRPGIEPGTFRV